MDYLDRLFRRLTAPFIFLLSLGVPGAGICQSIEIRIGDQPPKVVDLANPRIDTLLISEKVWNGGPVKISIRSEAKGLKGYVTRAADTVALPGEITFNGKKSTGGGIDSLVFFRRLTDLGNKIGQRKSSVLKVVPQPIPHNGGRVPLLIERANLLMPEGHLVALVSKYFSGNGLHYQLAPTEHFKLSGDSLWLIKTYSQMLFDSLSREASVTATDIFGQKCTVTFTIDNRIYLHLPLEFDISILHLVNSLSPEFNKWEYEITAPELVRLPIAARNLGIRIVVDTSLVNEYKDLRTEITIDEKTREMRLKAFVPELHTGKSILAKMYITLFNTQIVRRTISITTPVAIDADIYKRYSGLKDAAVKKLKYVTDRMEKNKRKLDALNVAFIGTAAYLASKDNANGALFVGVALLAISYGSGVTLSYFSTVGGCRCIKDYVQSSADELAKFNNSDPDFLTNLIKYENVKMRNDLFSEIDKQQKQHPLFPKTCRKIAKDSGIMKKEMATSERKAK